jgi:hypothetical protein
VHGCGEDTAGSGDDAYRTVELLFEETEGQARLENERRLAYRTRAGFLLALVGVILSLAAAQGPKVLDDARALGTVDRLLAIASLAIGVILIVIAGWRALMVVRPVSDAERAASGEGAPDTDRRRTWGERWRQWWYVDSGTGERVSNETLQAFEEDEWLEKKPYDVLRSRQQSLTGTVITERRANDSTERHLYRTAKVLAVGLIAIALHIGVFLERGAEAPCEASSSRVAARSVARQAVRSGPAQTRSAGAIFVGQPLEAVEPVSASQLEFIGGDVKPFGKEACNNG